ncbi:MAG: class I adenylate-forming enzyme family protein [Rhodospirillaceae bacterium]|nr:class I adenylate-forming enzyme family protein [Rhodospirillaceae bacterium]
MPADLELDDLAGTGAARHPQRIAVEIGELKITYAAFAADVARMSAVLAAGGLKPGNRFGIASDDPYLSWLATLAGFRIGAVSVAVADITPAEIADRLTLAVIATSHTGLPERIGAASRRVTIDFAAMQAARERDVPARSPAAASQAGRILLSSGTTGRPKAVLLDATRLVATVATNQSRYSIDAQSRLFSLLGPNTGAGFRSVPLTWWQGGTVILRSGRSIRATAVAARTANRILLSPASLASLLSGLAADATPVPNLTVFVGGGRLSPNVRKDAEARLSTDLRIIYGASEIGGMCQCPAAALDDEPGLVGVPRPGVTIEIVDDDGRLLPRGTVGIVRIRADTMVNSYLDDPAATAAAFRDGWFYSGDVGKLMADGALVVSGRSNDVLNLGGVKLSPEDIEIQLAGMTGLADVCVVSLPDAAGSEVLTVAAVTAPGTAWRDLKDAIVAALHRHREVAVYRVDHIPRNAMGKIPRDAFRQRLMEAVAAEQPPTSS